MVQVGKMQVAKYHVEGRVPGELCIDLRNRFFRKCFPLSVLRQLAEEAWDKSILFFPMVFLG